MNSKMLYEEIGNIDDDLIQEASVVHGQKKKHSFDYRIFLSLAAFFCLICTGVLFLHNRDTINLNENFAPISSKVMVNEDENTVIVPLNYQELLFYFKLDQIPDVLGKNLDRIKTSDFKLYQNINGDVFFDENTLYYENFDKSKIVSVDLSKTNIISDEKLSSQERLKYSKINGIKMIIGVSNFSTEPETEYSARLKGL